MNYDQDNIKSFENKKRSFIFPDLSESDISSKNLFCDILSSLL